MTNKLQTLEKIREINNSFPSTPVKEWKEKGGKVIGWMCINVPEEIIHAAGMLPVRTTGDFGERPMEDANIHFSVYHCSFARTLLDMALKGEFDFLDGVISCSTCDGIRYLGDLWEQQIPDLFHHLMVVPRKPHERGNTFYQQEIKELVAKLEERFNVNITDSTLKESIAIYNKTRSLLKSLYETRKSAPPPISGSEVLEVLNASTCMPKEQFNPILEDLLDEVKMVDRKDQKEVRILLNGSILNNVDFIKGIEEQDAVVVVDSLCNGARYCWDLVDENTDLDPIAAIAQHYLTRFPCPRHEPWEDVRFNRILNLAEEFKVDGVINETIRYCVPISYNYPLLRNRLEDIGVPVMTLDVEYGMPATGQIRTRTQAFVEMIAAKK